MCNCNKPDTLHNVAESLKNKHGVREPHVHADVIRAWADGHQIEVFLGGTWQLARSPWFSEDQQYRVKPEPKPQTDLEKYGVEVGDVWCGYCPLYGEFSSIVMAVSSNQYVGYSTGACIDKGLLTELVFRRGVVNKLGCM